MKCNIFYSWETDLPNASNRGFIQAALEIAAKSIRDDNSINIEPVVDRDTVGIDPGRAQHGHVGRTRANT
jgi:hypothetical protein